MNPLTLVVAAALTLAAPAGWLTYNAIAPVPEAPIVDPADPNGSPVVAATTERAGAGLLRVRVHHDGDAGEALLSIRDGSTQIAQSTITLRPGEETLIDLPADARTYWIDIEAEYGSSRLSGSTDLDLAACPSGAGEVLFATYAASPIPVRPLLGSAGRLLDMMAYDVAIVVVPGGCMGGPARHIGVDTLGLHASAPYPECPLECSVEYGWLGHGGLRFDVPEGATRIEVNAWWDAVSPATETLEVGLFVPEGCASCWKGVARGSGEGSIAFVHEAPAPGRHALFASLAGPGAGVQQAVWLEAVVHFS